MDAACDAGPSTLDANQRYEPGNSPRQTCLLGGLSDGIDIFVRAGRLFGNTSVGTGAYQHTLFAQFINQLAPLPELRGLCPAHGPARPVAG